MTSYNPQQATRARLHLLGLGRIISPVGIARRPTTSRFIHAIPFGFRLADYWPQKTTYPARLPLF
jgi:hypothetical protein